MQKQTQLVIILHGNFEYSKKRSASARSFILNTIIWTYTQEGAGYWAKIIQKLN